MPQLTGVVCLGLGLLVVARLAGAEPMSHWRVDGELTLASDDNLSRAEFARDKIRDDSLLANVMATWHMQPTPQSSLGVRGFVEAERFDTVDTLNRTSVGGEFIGRWQAHLGYTQPVYQLSLKIQTDDYDVKQRDSTVYTGQAFATRRLNDRIRATYGLEGVKRDSDGTVFDLRHGRLFLSADVVLDAAWSAYGTYSYLHGDTFSSARFSFCDGAPATDIYGLVRASTAIEPDQAFNRKSCGNWLAYRLKANSHSLVLGLNRGFGEHYSADLSVQQLRVNAEGDNYYRRTILRAGVLARF